jgi:hypothetical protein
VSTLKEEILEQLQLKNEVGLSQLLQNCMTLHRMLNNIPLDNPVTEFKIPKFLLGIKPILNEVPKRDFTTTAIRIIKIVFDKFDYELSDKEILALYEIRGLGKFKKKDSVLLEELNKEYSGQADYTYEKYELRDILKELKNIGLIDFRRGAIMISDRVMLE